MGKRESDWLRGLKGQKSNKWGGKKYCVLLKTPITGGWKRWSPTAACPMPHHSTAPRATPTTAGGSWRSATVAVICNGSSLRILPRIRYNAKRLNLSIVKRWSVLAVDQQPQDKKNRYWSWLQFGIALSLIPIGLIVGIWGFVWGMGHTVGHKDGGVSEWLRAIGEYMLIGGYFIAVVGIIWTIALLVLRKIEDRLWSWKQFGIALCLIPLGIISCRWSLYQGYCVGGSAFAGFFFVGGFLIAWGGLIWTIVLLILLFVRLIRLFVLRRRSRWP